MFSIVVYFGAYHIYHFQAFRNLPRKKRRLFNRLTGKSYLFQRFKNGQPKSQINRAACGFVCDINSLYFKINFLQKIWISSFSWKIRRASNIQPAFPPGNNELWWSSSCFFRWSTCPPVFQNPSLVARFFFFMLLASLWVHLDFQPLMYFYLERCCYKRPAACYAFCNVARSSARHKLTIQHRYFSRWVSTDYQVFG